MCIVLKKINEHEKASRGFKKVYSRSFFLLMRTPKKLPPATSEVLDSGAGQNRLPPHAMHLLP